MISRIMGAIVLACALCACARPEVFQPGSVDVRWGDEPYVSQPMKHMIMVEPRGSHSLWLRYKRPPGATAVELQYWHGLIEARTGSTVLFDGHQRVLIVALPPGDDPIELHYDIVEPLRVYAIKFGDAEQLVRRAALDDAASAVVGIVLVTAGAISLLVFALSRRRNAPVAWLSSFAVASGIVQFSQVFSLRILVVPSTAFWRATVVVAVAGYLASFLMLVDSLFRLKDRVIHGLVAVSGLLVVVWAVLDVIGHPQTELIRRILYVAVGVGLVDVILRTGARARRGDETARLFVFGFVLMMTFALPDLIWGWGFQILPINTGPFGSLCFAVVVALILERRFLSQRDTLEHNVAHLEARGVQVQRLNTELRRQIAERSRELARLINNPELKASTNIRVGAAFGPYKLVDRLGEGGMGTVYRAERKNGGVVEHVALKVMAGSTSPEDATRFAREAEIASQLDHDNLVTVLDVGFTDGTLYLVMELVEGPSLEDMRDRFGDVQLVMPLLAQVARGLVVLHAAGVVHRDLKPGNVLITQKNARSLAKISDFGISHRAGIATSSDEIAATEQRITKAGAVMGTPLYMAPETMKGAALVDARADVFAFGVMAYESLTSVRPFHVAPALSVVVTGSLPPPPSLVSLGLVSVEVAELIDRCILLDPAQRPTAAEIVATLERV